jgi:hypothetical protein
MPTPNMNLTLPVDGGSSGTWGGENNTALTAVDGHDHTTGKGKRITPAALNINADVTMAGNSLTNVKSVDAAATAPASMTGKVRALWFNSTDSEWYLRNASGTDIKVTNSGALNVVGNGGIGGDYTTTNAEVNYEAANQRYRMWQIKTPQTWAKLATGEIQLHETGASITNRVVLKSPTALAASYNLTLPPATPASAQLLQMDAAGAVTANNTLAQPVTLTAAATLTGGIANNVSLAAGATAAVNQSITVSGTGRYKHGEMKLAYSALDFTAATAAALDVSTQWFAATAVPASFVCPVRLPSGARITSVDYAWRRSAGTVSASVSMYDASFGNALVISSTVTSLTTGSAIVVTSSGALNYTISDGYNVSVEFSIAGAIGPRVYGVIVRYDYP